METLIIKKLTEKIMKKIKKKKKKLKNKEILINVDEKIILHYLTK